MAKKQETKKGDPQGWARIKKKVKEMRAEMMIVNVVVIILGGLMIAIPDKFNEFMSQIFGTGLVLWGCLRCFSFLRLKNEDMFGSYALVQGAAMLGFGIFFLNQPEKFRELLNIALSIIIMMVGVLKVQNAINYLKLKSGKWWIQIIGAALLLTLGVIAISNPGNMSNNTLLIVTGAAFIVSGVWDIISIIIMSKIIKRIAKDIENGGRMVKAEAEVKKTDEKAEKKAEKKARKPKSGDETTHFGDDFDG